MVFSSLPGSFPGMTRMGIDELDINSPGRQNPGVLITLYLDQLILKTRKKARTFTHY